MSHRLAPSLLLVLALGACHSRGAPESTAPDEAVARGDGPQAAALRAPSLSPEELPAPEPSVADLELAFERAAEAIAPAVVSVINEQDTSAELPEFLRPLAPKGEARGMGSGVIIDEAGYILTNNHVVEGAGTLKVQLHDDRELHAELVGTDPKTDLAVIRIRAEGLRAASLYEGSGLRVGQWVLAVGSPFGLSRSVTAGIVSAVGRGSMGITDYGDFIQTDAAINRGNSGGPLIDLRGRVVGINTAIFSPNGGSSGIGFAIPSGMARAVKDQLISHGVVRRGWLGVVMGELSSDLARSFEYEGDHGVLIDDVDSSGPGAAAGIRAGDIVANLDGQPVRDMADFRNTVAQAGPGAVVTLEVWREGQSHELSVRLGELPGDGSDGRVRVAPKPKPTPAPAVQPLGLRLEEPDARVRRTLGLPPDGGAVITSVEPGSVADEAGLRRGDVVVGVGEQPAGSASEAQRLLERADLDHGVRIRVQRGPYGRFAVLRRRAEP
ncbi:trypsin-like peptidase domain-containing protein [Paraliomyxa miuraensis]|uniref:trypsin-like peptidase domain-containing protein n=1 Tax=Paraliomyxa miuraensis TaxID=376150 RepID=UPI002255826A|nr:trypsin-like peptidase domain-containing protein [Paraliomyxa miuraensis]MCX4245039.1 trypsin-like peptidase domain-containing protein [Paraliomyxa miuraensis]